MSTKTTCHPLKKHHAKGLCHACYQRINKSSTPRPKGYCKSKTKKWRVKHPEKEMLARVKHNSKRRGIPFSLELVDISIPQFCPVLAIPLEISKSGHLSDNSPSLDRIDNKVGYTKDNVIVVSNRVNRIKGDASLLELKKITSFYSALR